MVTETMFDADGWIARLGASLEALAPTATYSVSLEAGYVSHLSYDEFRAIQGEAGRDPAILDAVAPGYASLRSDAEEQRAMLHEHPVLKEVLKGSSGEEHMLLLRPGCSNGTNTKGLVSHLVAQSVKKSGADAAGVLHRFLAEGKDRRLDAREYVVIYGLKLTNRIQLGDGAFLAPLDDSFISQEGFSDEDGQRLRTVGVRGRAFRDGWGGSSVLVRDLEWGPGVAPDSADQDLDPVEVAWRFSCDVETVTDLLSVASHQPLVTSTRHVRVAKWMHEINPNLVFGWWGGGGFIYDGWWKEGDLAGEAETHFSELVAGWVGFQFRCDRERDALKLAVRRLAGSFGRTGRMQLQDRILDYAIALEILYRLDSSELTYKLATRAAWLLEKIPGRRLASFEKMTDFYDIRSAIVHGPTKKKHRKLGHEEIARACADGRDLACGTLSEILRRGRLPDWKQLIFDAEGEPGEQHPPKTDG